MAWILGRGVSKVELRTDREPAPAGRQRFADLTAARGFLRRFLDDPFDAATLRDVARRALLGRPGAGERELDAAIAAELVAGRLLVVDPQGRGERQGSGQGPRPVPPPPPGDLFEQLERGQDTDWVEIQLVDEDGRGVANARYVLVAPDGREFKGYTDGIGAARITRIPSGQCQLRFPDLERRDQG